MTFPLSLLFILGAAVLVSAMGFKNYVWFISLGYGFSIAAEGIVMLVLGVSLAGPLSRIFVGYDAELLALTTRGFRLYSLSFLLMGFNILEEHLR